MVLNLMNRQTISLKSRVRYEGLAQVFDRRTELEKIPNPIWYTVGHVHHKNFRKAIRVRGSGKTTPKAR